MGGAARTKTLPTHQCVGWLGFHPGNVLVLEKIAWPRLLFIHSTAILTLTKLAQIPYAPEPEAVKREPLWARHEEAHTGASAGADGDNPPAEKA